MTTFTNQEDHSRSLWADFKQALIGNLERTADRQFWDVWHNCTNRTRFYTGDLLPRMARGLGMTHALEVYNLRVDFVMRDPANGVPRVFIESENTARDAINNEIPKLCALAAPLKVLLTCVEWDETPGVWRHSKLGRSFVADWEPLIRRHATAWPQPSILGVIVGEWSERTNNRLRFYSMAYDGFSGERIEPAESTALRHQGEVLWERAVPPVALAK